MCCSRLDGSVGNVAFHPRGHQSGSSGRRQEMGACEIRCMQNNIVPLASATHTRNYPNSSCESCERKADYLILRSVKCCMWGILVVALESLLVGHGATIFALSSNAKLHFHWWNLPRYHHLQSMFCRLFTDQVCYFTTQSRIWLFKYFNTSIWPYGHMHMAYE